MCLVPCALCKPSTNCYKHTCSCSCSTRNNQIKNIDRMGRTSGRERMRLSSLCVCCMCVYVCVLWIHSVLVILHTIKTLFPRKSGQELMVAASAAFLRSAGDPRPTIQHSHSLCNMDHIDCTMYISLSLRLWLASHYKFRVCICGRRFRKRMHITYGYAHIIIGHFTFSIKESVLCVCVCVCVCKFSIIGL